MKNVRILIVEDERIIAMDLQLQLQALGYQVCGVVASGSLAIAHAEREQPDLVLMDIHLEGGMDGVDAACEIYRRQKIPIVFLSAYAENATLQRAESAMPYGYLVKPVSPRELHATLQMAMVRFGLQHRADEQLGRIGKAMQAAELDVWEWRVETDHMQTFSLAGPPSQRRDWRPIHRSATSSNKWTPATPPRWMKRYSAPETRAARWTSGSAPAPGPIRTRAGCTPGHAASTTAGPTGAS
ncbi:response regulator [Chromobacterium vaccinii]|uniref:response regulator n=1 Tax=Chromobacterium vaccinii TaxID=1108595 RepID=UPI000E203BFC|nr:response regulator [Chromobacterium vaccinii]